MKIAEDLIKLREIGVSHFKTEGFEVTFFPLEVAKITNQFNLEDLEKTINQTVDQTIDEELFNQGI